MMNKDNNKAEILDSEIHGAEIRRIIDWNDPFFPGFLELYTNISGLFSNWDKPESIAAWFEPDQDEDETMETLLFVSVNGPGDGPNVASFMYAEYYKKEKFIYIMYLGNTAHIKRNAFRTDDNERLCSKGMHERMDGCSVISFGNFLMRYIDENCKDCREVIVAVDSERNYYESRMRLYRIAYNHIRPGRDVYLIEQPKFIEPITYIWNNDTGKLQESIDELVAKEDRYHPIPFLYIPISLADHSVPPAIPKKRVERIVRTILMDSYRNAYYYDKKKNKEYREYVKKFYKKYYENECENWPAFVKLKRLSDQGN